MKKSCLLLVAVILIAGCTQSGLTPVVKSLPEVKEFLNQYPEATITASAYSPTAVKFVVENFREHCPNLGEEGKSYQKVTVIDGKTRQTLIVWVEAKNNEFVCAIRTSLSGEIVATTSSTTTTIPPTTTAQITTTSPTLPSTTTTLAPTTTINSSATTTSSASTSSTTSSTTTTTAPPTYPDLYVSKVEVKKGASSQNHVNITMTFSNAGSASSNFTNVNYTLYKLSGGVNTTMATPVRDLNSISPGASISSIEWPDNNFGTESWYIDMIVDQKGNNTELKENNNYASVGFSTPLSNNLSFSFTP